MLFLRIDDDHWVQTWSMRLMDDLSTRSAVSNRIQRVTSNTALSSLFTITHDAFPPSISAAYDHICSKRFTSPSFNPSVAETSRRILKTVLCNKFDKWPLFDYILQHFFSIHDHLFDMVGFSLETLRKRIGSVTVDIVDVDESCGEEWFARKCGTVNRHCKDLRC